MRCQGCGMLSTVPFAKCSMCWRNSDTYNEKLDSVRGEGGQDLWDIQQTRDTLKRISKDRTAEALIDYVELAKREKVALKFTAAEEKKVARIQGDMKRECKAGGTKVPMRTIQKIRDGYYD